MAPHRNKLWVWFVAVAYAILSAGADCLYFCVTEEGHVKVEYALDGRCSASSPVSSDILSGEHPAIAAARNDCGACTDLPLSMVSYFRQGGNIRMLLLTPADGPWVFTANLSSGPLPEIGRESGCFAKPYPPPDLLRSVILLI